ncbi:hypothetical protein BDEG_21840 [Batrachochytrium dendrobatidis JEL423]|uniref:Nitric oxide synthase-interacting protein zinc-finger domain-containing protein n=1 Tax=Batrachochytrium dendrobatidis (strain JEL423) TaxID=403673 RepID=A0A177WCP2_BATDL|nr:hypothetical protein BDEG_21840 [Batrachochytrium dendrobatidis JEL423]
MPRHSKNNTALAFFTSAERSKLTYGTQKQRLGRDSMRDYDACLLCLRAAVQPVCCAKGHLYCKECIFESILAQKKQILRQSKDIKNFEQSIEAEHASKAEETQKKQIEDFKNLETHSTSVQKKNGNADIPTPGLSNFWLASPSFNLTATVLKKLIPVVFAQSSTSAGLEKKLERPGKHCPCCLTTFRNGVKIVGESIMYIACNVKTKGPCFIKFTKSSCKCVVCDVKCKERDVIDLDIEGTGFSSGGQAEASRGGPAFQ